VDTSNALPVNSTIAGAACYFNMNKPGLTQDALNQTLKTGRIKSLSKNG